MALVISAATDPVAGLQHDDVPPRGAQVVGQLEALAAAAAGARSHPRLIAIARACGVGPGGGTPKILLVALPPIQKLTDFVEMFEGGTEKSRLLGQRTQV